MNMRMCKLCLSVHTHAPNNRGKGSPQSWSFLPDSKGLQHDIAHSSAERSPERFSEFLACPNRCHHQYLLCKFLCKIKLPEIILFLFIYLLIICLSNWHYHQVLYLLSLSYNATATTVVPGTWRPLTKYLWSEKMIR